MKKSLKIGLITGVSILTLGGTRAGLTKIGIIPNWFDIEILCPGQCPSGYKMIFGKCHEEGRPNWGNNGCLNCEYNEAADECSKYYKLPNVEGYTKENYEKWIKDKNLIIEEQKGISSFTEDNLLYLGYDGLITEHYYEDWINDQFNGYQNELKEYEKHQASCNSYRMVLKPIIYLYPTTTTQIQVKLGTPKNLSHTYPKYIPNEGRNVIAQPNGDLEDTKTGRKLYALYREGVAENKPEITEGFVVKGEDIITFLEEKLAILGLNEREAEEFIVYRLPQMESNPYNLVRFETIEEQNEAMPLIISPSPDSIIRIMMDWKALDDYIEVPEQKLSTHERNGFTVVERGGSIIK